MDDLYTPLERLERILAVNAETAVGMVTDLILECANELQALREEAERAGDLTASLLDDANDEITQLHRELETTTN